MNILFLTLSRTIEIESRNIYNDLVRRFVQNGHNVYMVVPFERNTGRKTEVLHSMGAVHRDVKPENVILRGNEAVLIDFDAARIYKDECESDTQVLGTMGFAAPEQYGIVQSDARADIFSLGVLLNIMLTGRHPSRAMAAGHMGRIVRKCTMTAPEQRYQSVQALMEVL